MAKSEVGKPKSARDWTELDVATGLRVLALYGGNASKASRALIAEGRPIPESTLLSWRNERYAVQYEDLVYEMRQSIGQKVSDESMEIAAKATEVESALIAATQANLHEIPAKDLAKAALNMAQIKRTNIESARLLRNEPTQITETRNVNDSLEELKSLGVIDVEAVEEE